MLTADKAVGFLGGSAESEGQKGQGENGLFHIVIRYSLFVIVNVFVIVYFLLIWMRFQATRAKVAIVSRAAPMWLIYFMAA